MSGAGGVVVVWLLRVKLLFLFGPVQIIYKYCRVTAVFSFFSLFFHLREEGRGTGSPQSFSDYDQILKPECDSARDLASVLFGMLRVKSREYFYVIIVQTRIFYD